MNVADFLSGRKILARVHSPVNGELVVIKDLAWGVHVKGGGLTQSGGVAEKVWKTALIKLKREKKEAESVLILGLGAGSIAKLTRSFWPESDITGVDVDRIIVDLGKKYMDLNKYRVKVVIESAEKFLEKAIKRSEKYNLVLVDVYVEDQVPEKFESKEFLEDVKAVLAKEGAAVFNRLYYDDKRKLAAEFLRKLIHSFRKVKPVYPEANVMYLCFV